MIPTLESQRADSRLTDIVQQSAQQLHPLLKRLINPNVVDVKIRLEFHLQAGSLTHFRCVSDEPAYCLSLGLEADEERFKKTFADCLRVVRQIVGARLGRGCHGVISLHIALSGGEATVSTVADVVSKLGK